MQTGITKVRARIATVQEAIAALSKELEDLKVAERVLSTLEGESSSSVWLQPRTAVQSEKATVGDHIVRILGEKGPMQSPDILNELVAEGLETTSNTVSTTLSRLKATGKVRLYGTRTWMTPESFNERRDQDIADLIGISEGKETTLDADDAGADDSDTI